VEVVPPVEVTPTETEETKSPRQESATEEPTSGKLGVPSPTSSNSGNVRVPSPTPDTEPQLSHVQPLVKKLLELEQEERSLHKRLATVARSRDAVLKSMLDADSLQAPPVFVLRTSQSSRRGSASTTPSHRRPSMELSLFDGSEHSTLLGASSRVARNSARNSARSSGVQK